MPNWNHNRVYFVCDSQEEADEVVRRLAGVDCEGKEQEFTFNAFIPMPKELDITSGSETSLNFPRAIFRASPSSFGQKIQPAAH